MILKCPQGKLAAVPDSDPALSTAWSLKPDVTANIEIEPCQLIACPHKPVFRGRRWKIEELLDETRIGICCITELQWEWNYKPTHWAALSSFWPLDSSKPKTERELAFWLHLMLLLISCKIWPPLRTLLLILCKQLDHRPAERLSLGQQEVSVDKRSKFRNASPDFILIQSLVKLSFWGQSQNKNELTG